MRSRWILIAALTLAAPQAAQAGFWGDLKHSVETAAGNAERDGAKAAHAVGDAADAVVEGTGAAADAVTEGAENVEGYIDGQTDAPAEAPPQPVARPAASDSAAKDLSKDPIKQ